VQAESRAPKGLDLPAQESRPSDQWLEDADGDADRFRKLEIYLRGFSTAMQDVGQRYGHLHQAITDENLPLAKYHWDKIRDAINVGLMKRPGRTSNAEAIFLDVAWPAMAEVLDSSDIVAVRAGFEKARKACVACHVAEGVHFLNDQPLFRDLRFE